MMANSPVPMPKPPQASATMTRNIWTFERLAGLEEDERSESASVQSATDNAFKNGQAQRRLSPDAPS
jgi:hypothetical protein